MSDLTIRALERRLLVEKDLSLIPLLANIYARAGLTQPINFWLATNERTRSVGYPPTSITNSLHATRQGALEWIGLRLRQLSEQGDLSGDGVAVLRALDDPARGAEHAFTLYRHRLRDWGSEGCGNSYLSLREMTLMP